MDLFYILLVLLVFSRFLGEVAVRLRQPALLGELVAGVLLGLVGGHFPETFPILADLPENEVFIALTDLGIFFLMLLGGLELHPKKLEASSGPALGVGLAAMGGPLVLGLGAAWLFIPASDYKLAQSAFVGIALAITAVPVSIRVLMDLDLLKSRMGSVIVGAAVIEEILGLVSLAVLTALIRTGGFPGTGQLLLLAGKVTLFFLIAGGVGLWVLPRVGEFIKRYVEVEELELSFLLVVAFALSVLAELLSMHFIVGAFMAGLIFSKNTLNVEIYHDVKTKLSGVTMGFLAPLFFASIGLHLELAALGAIPAFVAVLLLIAFVSKFAFGALPARWMGGFTWQESSAVGMAMCARGAVELVIAGIALQAGLFQHPDPTPATVEHLFSAIVIVAMVTTLAAPVALRWLLGHHPELGEEEGDGTAAEVADE